LNLRNCSGWQRQGEHKAQKTDTHHRTPHDIKP
jgi:hypothetical protein